MMKRNYFFIIIIIVLVILGFIVFNNSNSEDTYRFIVHGDTQKRGPESYESHEKIINIIRKENPDFVIHVGDLVENANDVNEWELFVKNNKKIDNIQFYSVIGNHEYTGDASLSNYNKYVGTMKQVYSIEHYYSIDYEGSHFIFLNSNAYSGVTMVEDRLELRANQLNWLKDDLEKNQNAEHIFVFLHHPFYVGGCWNDYKPIKEAFQPLFEKYGVDVVFNGHVHLYERSIVDGITYITTGGGRGSSL